MTRVLDLTDHTFIHFVTSEEYDLAHNSNIYNSERSINWEDSYAYSVGQSLESWLESVQPLCLFEIFYD